MTQALLAAINASLCSFNELDLEGIVAKRKTVAYRATEKASPYWIKIKNPNYSQAEGRDELFNPKSDGIIQISGPPSNGLIAEFIRRKSYSH